MNGLPRNEQSLRKVTLGLILLAGFSVLGCDAQPQKKPAGKVSTPQPESKTDSPEATKGPEETKLETSVVTPVDAEELQAAVDKHAGKVVLVDCWATWCKQCINDFPHTVEMGKKYADQGLVVMSLSFDEVTDESRLKKVREFLVKQDAQFEHYISKLDMEKEGAVAFHIEDGALPHYKLYGRDGKLLKELTNADPDMPMSHADLEAIVEEALKAN